MREIKFRFWKHGNMDYDFDGWGEDVSTNYHFQYCINNSIPIMQFTGLEDKNGNDIYEGDLVRVYGEIREVKFEYAFWWMKEVDMIAENVIGGFGTPQDNKHKPHKPLYRYGDIEVVGNIYQTPELLNQNTTA